MSIRWRAISAVVVAATALCPPAWAGVGLENMLPKASTSGFRSPALAAAVAPSQVAPIGSNPHRKSYSRWASEWWQWVLETPASENPLLDTTGAKCKVGQRGYVWFLAGSVGTAHVSRRCEVPAGSALFFPLLNNLYAAVKGDPANTKTEAYCRAQVEYVINPGNTLALQIDRKPIQGLRALAERSVLFDAQLPADNIFGLVSADPSVRLLSPACDAGYFVFLSPLPPGRHTVRWVTRTADGSFGQDIIYHLDVK